MELNRKIIQSYAGKKVVFVAEQDQFYQDQYGVMDELKRKFYQAPARKKDHLIYSSENFNIAIHVRRGDIMADPTNPNLVMRYLSNDYLKRYCDKFWRTFIRPNLYIFIFSPKASQRIIPNLHNSATCIGA